MTQEEKAKRYDEAIEKFDVILNLNTVKESGTIFANDVRKIFPELKESEDDRMFRIIKEVILKSVPYKENILSKDTTITAEEAITWIENQGKRKYRIIVLKFKIGDKVTNGKDIYTIDEIDEDCYWVKECNSTTIPFVYQHLWKLVEQTPAWLEKQGNKVVNEELSKLLNKVICRFINDPNIPYSERDEVSKKIVPYVEHLEKVGEQKPADKVEPKFHEGEWVVYECGEETATLQITKIVEETYVFSDDSTLSVVDEDALRLWDITKDAKDGDVLAFDNEGSNYHSIGIFKRIASKNELNGNTYRCYVRYGGFKEKLEIPTNGDELHHCGTSAHPATKEQRNTLMKEMADAGYTFDFEKKELMKIEQKPAWSEEDEGMFVNLVAFLEGLCGTIDGGTKTYAKWLKERYKYALPMPHWKPSDLQIKALEYYTKIGCVDKEGIFGSELVKLLEELKRL